MHKKNSYKKKNSDGDDDEEMTGVDLFAELPFNINFFGFSSYNLDTDGFGEHSYDVRFDISDFHFRPFYQRFRYVWQTSKTRRSIMSEETEKVLVRCLQLAFAALDGKADSFVCSECDRQR